jgi:hypothetical protein
MKKTLIGHQYFIEIINILHKLLDALVASRLTLVGVTQLVVIGTELYFSE